MATQRKQLSFYDFLKTIILYISNVQISASNILSEKKLSSNLEKILNEKISDYGIIVFYFIVLDCLINHRILVAPNQLHRIFSEAYLSIIKDNNPNKTKKEIQIELLFMMEKIQQYEKYIITKLLMNNPINLEKTSYDYLVWRAFSDQLIMYDNKFKNAEIDLYLFLGSVKENIINPIKFNVDTMLNQFNVIYP